MILRVNKYKIEKLKNYYLLITKNYLQLCINII